jgi:REP element-mobilizing transposase RayT
VTARGDHRQAIFCDGRDEGHFLELLAQMRERFRVQVLAYVLMGNHYHLMVCTPEANLSRAMQWLNVSYSVWFNKRRGEVGHVFQGRFKAMVVEGEGWGIALSEYVHLNPVRIKALGQGERTRAAERQGLGRPPTREEVAARLERLRRYRGSSYRAYAGYAKTPEWLDTEVILSRAGGAAAYRQSVADRVRQGVEEAPWRQAKWGLVLGGEAFAQRIRKQLKAGREVAGRRGLRQRRRFEEIVRVVERLTGEAWAAFCDRHGDRRRDLVLWVARRCTGLTAAELGREAGGMDYAAVTMAVRRFQVAQACDRALARLTDRVVAECQ